MGIISVNKSSKFEPKILKLMFDSIMEHIRNVCSYEDNYLISYKKVCDIVKGILAKNKLEHLFEYIEKIIGFKFFCEVIENSLEGFYKFCYTLVRKN